MKCVCICDVCMCTCMIIICVYVMCICDVYMCTCMIILYVYMYICTCIYINITHTQPMRRGDDKSINEKLLFKKIASADLHKSKYYL